MIKALSITFIFFLALMTPVKESSVSMLEEKSATSKLKKIVILTEAQKLIAESESLDFSQILNDDKEINSAYSQKNELEINYIEVEKVNELSIVDIVKSPKLDSRKNSVVEMNSMEDLDVSELSYSEMNEQSYNGKKLNIIAHTNFNFKLRKYESLNNNELIEDRISTAVAANEKSNSVPVEQKVLKAKEFEGTHDELVFFNYTEDGKVNVDNTSLQGVTNKTKLTEKLKVVATATHQQVNSQKPLPLLDNQKILNLVKGNKSRSDIDYSKITKSRNGKPEKLDFIPDHSKMDGAMQSLIDRSKKNVDYRCMQNSKSKTVNSEYSLSLTEIDYSKSEYLKLHNFEIEFSDDGSRLSDDSTGAIELSFNLNSNMNIRRGTVFNSKIYPITTDFVFEGGSHKIELPAFEKETFNSIVKGLGITGFGGHVLIQLDDTTEDTDLDVATKYQAKVFLDNNLEVVDRGNSSYSYVLYLGVDAGNTIISFKNNNNEVTTKIIHITEDEIYFDPNFYAEVMNDEVSFYQENLTTQCKSLLNMDTKHVNPWSFKTKKTKKTLNMIGFDRMVYPLGTRKYYELTHLEESLYIGKWSEANVVVPTESYVRHVLESLEVRENNCMVQLNTSKKILEFGYNGISSRNEIRPEVSYLDDDGIFYDEVSPETKKVFVKGEEQGLLNIKLKYVDGSSQFIQTFCSDNTYLVEQL